MSDQSEQEYLTQRLWFGWPRHRWQLLAFCALIVLTLLGFWQDNLQDARERREDKAEVEAQLAHDDQEETDEDYLACLRGNFQRDAISDLIRISYDNPGIDLTTIPGFNDLPESVRRWVENVRDFTAQSGDPEDDPTSRISMALATQVPRDCESDYPAHTRGIEGRANPPTTTPSGDTVLIVP